MYWVNNSLQFNRVENVFSPFTCGHVAFRDISKGIFVPSFGCICLYVSILIKFCLPDAGIFFLHWRWFLVLSLIKSRLRAVPLRATLPRSTRRAYINFFHWFLFYFLTGVCDFAKKEGLHVVYIKIAVTSFWLILYLSIIFNLVYF